LSKLGTRSKVRMKTVHSERRKEEDEDEEERVPN
jgi:hypothetical protein